MLVSFGFLLVMILAGGLVALIADKLGRTLGKKRLTLFGMRPRHTATTMTVAAGMLIPLITVLFVATVSKPAREWILRGQAAIEENKQLLTTNQNLAKDIEKSTATLGGIKKQRDDLSDDVARLTTQFRTVTTKFQQLQTRAAQLTSRISTLQAKVTDQQRKVNLGQQQLASANRELVETNRELDGAEKSLATMTRDFGGLRNNYTSLQNNYAELDKQREEANNVYLKVTDQNDQLTKLNAKLSEDNQKASQQLKDTQAELDEAQKAVATARSQYSTYASLYANNIGRTRFNPMIFQIGDELARVAVPKGTDAQSAKGLFASLIRQSVVAATAKGAKASGKNDAAGLITRPDEKGEDASPERQEAKLIELMTKSNEDLVIIATSSFNTYLEEWVPLSVQIYHNPTIYRRDEKVAEVMINGSDSEAQIIQHISDFLTQTVRPKALKDHLIPVAGKEESFGEIPLASIVGLAQEIEKMNRPIRLSAHADVDTRAADPLRLHFRWR